MTSYRNSLTSGFSPSFVALDGVKFDALTEALGGFNGSPISNMKKTLNK